MSAHPRIFRPAPRVGWVESSRPTGFAVGLEDSTHPTRLLVCRLGVLFLTAALGCQPNVDAPRTTETPARSSSLPTVKPTRKTLHRRIELPGQIEAFEQTPIYVKIPGYVETVARDMGDRVKKGDLLAKLSVPEMDEELKQKTALVDQAQAETDLAEQSFEAAKASFETAKAMVDVAISGRLRADALVKRWQSEYNVEFPLFIIYS